ncbi:MAG: DUF2277 family protein [Chloroflexota bacterium]
MCRSIKQLRRAERDVSEAEIQAAALQFVRTVSGYRQPARANAAAFDAAVGEIADATRRLLVEIGALAVASPEPR